MNAPGFRIFATLVATLFIAGISSSLRAEIVHGPIYNPATGNLYFLLSRNTWTASEAEAQILGGHLATISDDAEQAWIFRTFGMELGGGRLLWIGLNDAADEGTYRWSSGDEYSYAAWAPGEPNATEPTEDFVAIYYSGHSAQGQWNDWSNIQADPIGIPIMGVAEISPRDFQPRLRTIHFLDFEYANSMNFLPAPVPSDAYLTDQYLESLGVFFSSGNEPAVAVQLGEGHAVSGINGFAGMTNGILNYSAPVEMRFWTPGYPDLAATTDLVSLRLDQLGGGDGPVTLSAYNVAGDLLASTNVSDVGGRVLAISAPGIHRIIFQGNGSAALDDLFFANLTSTRPILRVQREGPIVRISWPFAFFGWSLQYAETLEPPINWKLSNSLEEFSNDELSIRMPSESPMPLFFRLTKSTP